MTKMAMIEKLAPEIKALRNKVEGDAKIEAHRNNCVTLDELVRYCEKHEDVVLRVIQLSRDLKYT